MDLVFATHNPNKIREVAPLLPAHVHLHTLASLGFQEEIPETGKTLEENAVIKAKYVLDTFGYACFADDTGLLVTALGGAPGVYSARYAGEQKNSNDNMDRLLSELGDTPIRDAKFETVIALAGLGEITVFKGTVEGQIAKEKTGLHGFGYDPVFIPKGYDRSFAEFTMEEKNRISHRARALEQLIAHLNGITPP